MRSEGRPMWVDIHTGTQYRRHCLGHVIYLHRNIHGRTQVEEKQSQKIFLFSLSLILGREKVIGLQRSFGPISLPRGLWVSRNTVTHLSHFSSKSSMFTSAGFICQYVHGSPFSHREEGIYMDFKAQINYITLLVY